MMICINMYIFTSVCLLKLARAPQAPRPRWRLTATDANLTRGDQAQKTFKIYAAWTAAWSGPKNGQDAHECQKKCCVSGSGDIGYETEKMPQHNYNVQNRKRNSGTRRCNVKTPNKRPNTNPAPAYTYYGHVDFVPSASPLETMHPGTSSQLIN